MMIHLLPGNPVLFNTGKTGIKSYRILRYKFIPKNKVSFSLVACLYPCCTYEKKEGEIERLRDSETIKIPKLVILQFIIQ